jgi:glutaminyl-tRNA synthetase
VREDLNRHAQRRMAVLAPLKVVIENYPEGDEEEFELDNNPEDPGAGTRRVPFSRELWIDRDDFREVPPPKYFRLSPGTEVRLRGAYWLRCTGVTKDPGTGEVREVARHDRSRDAQRQRARRPQGEGHDPLGLGAPCDRGRGAARGHAVLERGSRARTRGRRLDERAQPGSLEVLDGCKLERSLAGARRARRPVRARGLLRRRRATRARARRCSCAP